jgi:hypothetical protein
MATFDITQAINVLHCSAGDTVNLPDLRFLPDAFEALVSGAGSGEVSVVPTANQTIGGETTYTITSPGLIKLVSNGVSDWLIVATGVSTSGVGGSVPPVIIHVTDAEYTVDPGNGTNQILVIDTNAAITLPSVASAISAGLVVTLVNNGFVAATVAPASGDGDYIDGTVGSGPFLIGQFVTVAFFAVEDTFDYHFWRSTHNWWRGFTGSLETGGNLDLSGTNTRLGMTDSTGNPLYVVPSAQAQPNGVFNIPDLEGVSKSPLLTLTGELHLLQVAEPNAPSNGWTIYADNTDYGLKAKKFDNSIVNLTDAAPASSGVTTIREALAFSAPSSQRVNIPDGSGLNPTTALTIEAWFKMDDFSTSGTVIHKQTGSDAGEQYSIIVDNGRVDCSIESATDGQFWTALTAEGAITAGEWYHIAFTCDNSGDTAKVYINGRLAVASSSAPLDLTFRPSTGNDAWVGYSGPYENDEYTTGAIADLRIYDVARSAGQIASDFQFGVSPPYHPNLRAYYKFDEGSGTSVDDSISHNAGTLINTPVWTTGPL